MNKLETQLETTSHLYKRSDADSSWWVHALKYFVGAGLLIKATPPQAVKYCQ